MVCDNVGRIFIIFAAGLTSNEQSSSYSNDDAWSEQCVWFPIRNATRQLVDACNIQHNNRTISINFDAIDRLFTSSIDACGYCSYRL